MRLKVKEVADLVGISVRTLHHYDEIGLLTPDDLTDSGYRLYSKKNLEMLQQILFFKELDFPLKKIKEIIDRPSFDKKEALKLHRKMLITKRRSLEKMISTIDKTMQHEEGLIQMSNKEKFEGFDFSHNPFEEEARKRWGDEVINKTNEKINSNSHTDGMSMNEKMNAIYLRLAKLKDSPPESNGAQAGIKQWYEFLNNNTGHHYSLEAFKGLGHTYVSDKRFTKNIDQFGEGLAEFMQEAMGIYAERNRD